MAFITNAARMKQLPRALSLAVVEPLAQGPAGESRCSKRMTSDPPGRRWHKSPEKLLDRTQGA